jgi:hypothetical protein
MGQRRQGIQEIRRRAIQTMLTPNADQTGCQIRMDQAMAGKMLVVTFGFQQDGEERHMAALIGTSKHPAGDIVTCVPLNSSKAEE